MLTVEEKDNLGKQLLKIYFQQESGNYLQPSWKTRRKLPALIYSCLENSQLGNQVLKKRPTFKPGVLGGSDQQLKKTASLENSRETASLTTMQLFRKRRHVNQQLN
jgi:hypothetical protein